MFLPIRTDRPLRRTPSVNYALIATNVLVFIIVDIMGDARLAEWKVGAMLNPIEPRLYQFITYQFLHQGLWHLAGNMLFLWVFGNSVEDRLGKGGYLAFYLAAGIVAGIGHISLETSYVLGASGAVCAVAGAFLAFFPLTNITIVYFFFIIGAFEVSGLLLILFQIGHDVLFYLGRGGGVAYLAHLSGYAMGFSVGMGCLLSRLLPREPYDLLSLVEQRRRRAKFRAATRSGYSPWEGSASDSIKRRGRKEGPPNEQQQRIMALRADINAAIDRGDLAEAARLYLDLLEIDGSQTLGYQSQLDVGNQLMAESKHEQAATTYELLLTNFPRDPQRQQVQLILGLIYVRYLQRWQRARELLREARNRLDDPNQKQLANDLLSEIDAD